MPLPGEGNEEDINNRSYGNDINDDGDYIVMIIMIIVVIIMWRIIHCCHVVGVKLSITEAIVSLSN
jgi:hypothetical protein